MYSPQPMQIQMQPQRQFGVRDFITAIIYVIVGVAILIGFFALPLFNPDQPRRNGFNSTASEYSASRIIEEASRLLGISHISEIARDTRTIEQIAPYLSLYTFIMIALLYFLGAFSAVIKAIFRGGQRIGFFSGIVRIITVPIFYILLPLAVIIAFYAFATGLYDISDVIARPSSFRLEAVREIINQIYPGLGMILMLGASIFGAVITILFTIIGMFTRPKAQVIMTGQPAYGMPPQNPYGTPTPQYPPQYGQPQYPPYGQYPPQQNPYGAPPPQYPPTQTPPYQHPPVQNPYGGNQPPQNPYGAPNPYAPNQPSQNPINWGKKRDDDDEF